jgi:peptidyl-prolyl cis-trans isomerase D
MRKEIMVNKIQNLAYSSAIVTKQEVDQALVEKHKTAKLEYIGFDPGKFRDQVKTTPEELRASYEREKATYNVPAKRSFDVLVVDQARVEQSIEVSDAQLRAAYAGNMDNFRTPEQVRARHILVMTQGKPDGDKGKLKAKAEDLLKQLKAGADFAELAKKNSDDPGSGAQGGDLGFFTKGKMVKEFDAYSFSAKLNELSPLIETSFGYHIIQVTDKQPAKVRPFEEVKDAIAKQLKQQNVADKTQQLADQARAALAKAPSTAGEIAKQLNIQMAEAKELQANQPVPGLGTFNEIEGALASMKVGDVSDAIVLPGNRMAVVTLKGLTPARPADYADVQEQVKQRYISDESRRLATAASQAAGKRALAGEDLAVIAKTYNLPVTTTNDVTINDSAEGLGPVATLPDAFAKPAGSVIGPVAVQGRNIVYKIAAQKQVDPNEYTYERDAIYKELKQKKARTAYELMQDSILAQARADKNLKIYGDRVRKLAATYSTNR